MLKELKRDTQVYTTSQSSNTTIIIHTVVWFPLPSIDLPITMQYTHTVYYVVSGADRVQRTRAA